MPGLRAVDVSGNGVGGLCRNDEIRRQAAAQREAAERNRSVEENSGDENLWREQIEDPRCDEQAVTEQGHCSAAFGSIGGGA